MAFLGEVEQKQIFRGYSHDGRVVPAALVGEQTLYHLADIASDRSAKILAEAWAKGNPFSDYAAGSYKNEKDEMIPAVFRADSSQLRDMLAGRVPVPVIRRQRGDR